MDRTREIWWMYRCDGWPAGVWEFTLDPMSVEADWKVKVGSNKSFVERRVTHAREQAESRGRMLALRAIIDKIRASGG